MTSTTVVSSISSSISDFSSPAGLPGVRRRTRVSLIASKLFVRKKLFRRPDVALESIADRTWEIAPGETVITRRTFSLPNQLERVTGSAYTDDPRREMAAGIEVPQAPVRAFLVKNAWLIDGALYKASSSHWLNPRTKTPPPVRVDYEMDRGAVYSTFEGNAFFGLWLTDDCATYSLAASEGTPFTTDRPISPHMRSYEEWLDMRPLRVAGAFLREAVFFQDFCQTQHKRKRFRAMVNKLLSRVDARPHPGVFILRRDTGKRRIMHNEMEMAERMRTARGFRVVDITVDDLPTIMAACAGARTVMGVEGSQLIHGIMALQPGGSVLTLQPPDRFCAVIKRTTDPDGQDFAFVVGHPEPGGFRVDGDEVERTLDLLPRA